MPRIDAYAGVQDWCLGVPPLWFPTAVGVQQSPAIGIGGLGVQDGSGGPGVWVQGWIWVSRIAPAWTPTAGCFFSDPPSDRVFQSGRTVGRESSSRGRR